MFFFCITHMVVIVPNRNKIVLINKNYFIMITKSLNETHYELVASAANGKFRFLNIRTAVEIQEELRDDADYYANEGIARVKAKLRLARFTHDTWNPVIACDEYKDALDYIFNEELKYKYPRYYQFARECAYAISHRFYETDCEIDIEFMEKVDKFYREKSIRRRK